MTRHPAKTIARYFPAQNGWRGDVIPVRASDGSDTPNNIRTVQHDAASKPPSYRDHQNKKSGRLTGPKFAGILP